MESLSSMWNEIISECIKIIKDKPSKYIFLPLFIYIFIDIFKVNYIFICIANINDNIYYVELYQLSINDIYIKIIYLIHGCPFILELDIDSYSRQFKELVIESNDTLQTEYEDSFRDLIRGLYGLCILPPLPSIQDSFMVSIIIQKLIFFILKFLFVKLKYL